MNDKKINFPETLVCDDVVLERLEHFHTEDLYNTIIENRDNLKTFMHWLGDDYSIDDQDQFANSCEENWEEDKEYTYLIIDKKEDKIIGAISASKKSTLNGTYDLGYWLIKSHQGKGLMVQAVNEITDFILQNLGIKVALWTEKDNIASIRVALKSDFLFERASYDGVIENGNVLDTYYFCKLKDEAKMKKLSLIQEELKKVFDLNQ